MKKDAEKEEREKVFGSSLTLHSILLERTKKTFFLSCSKKHDFIHDMLKTKKEKEERIGRLKKCKVGKCS